MKCHISNNFCSCKHYFTYTLDLDYPIGVWEILPHPVTGTGIFANVLPRCSVNNLGRYFSSLMYRTMESVLVIGLGLVLVTPAYNCQLNGPLHQPMASHAWSLKKSSIFFRMWDNLAIYLSPDTMENAIMPSANGMTWNHYEIISSGGLDKRLCLHANKSQRYSPEVV